LHAAERRDELDVALVVSACSRHERDVFQWELLAVMQMTNESIWSSQFGFDKGTQVPFMRFSEQLQYALTGHPIVAWSQEVVVSTQIPFWQASPYSQTAPRTQKSPTSPINNGVQYPSLNV
jgi:hypothetical protein